MKKIANDFRLFYGNLGIRVWSKLKHIYVGHLEGTWLRQNYPLDDDETIILTLKWIYKINNIPCKYLRIHEYLKTDSGIRIQFETDKVAAQKINIDFIDQNRKLNCGLCLLNLQKVPTSVPNDQINRPSNGIIPTTTNPGPSSNIIRPNPADSVRSTGSYDELAGIRQEIGPPATPMPNSDSSSSTSDDEDE